eukprot:1081523-Pleurochrysis_carterae.AAC.3
MAGVATHQQDEGRTGCLRISRAAGSVATATAARCAVPSPALCSAASILDCHRWRVVITLAPHAGGLRCDVQDIIRRVATRQQHGAFRVNGLPHHYSRAAGALQNAGSGHDGGASSNKFCP